MMKVGLGMLNRSPREFWDMSLEEYNAAVQGLKQFHGVKEEPVGTREEMEWMMERFPDGPLPAEVKQRHRTQRSNMVH